MQARLAGLFLAALAAAAAGPFEWRETASSVALLNNGKVVWQFRYGKDVVAPLFHPIALSDGTVLTWDAPPDHQWHHALWFAWKLLNHANYWEYREGVTKEPRGIVEWSNVTAVRRPDSSAAIRMDLAYHEAGQPPVLTERRTVEISAPTADGQYHLDWTMVFTAKDKDVALDRTPITGEPNGVPFGGYAGLSIRFAKELGEWKAVSTKGPVARDAAAQYHCETGAGGIDFSGAIAGREAGIALLDHPANLNAPTPWYIVMNPKTSFAFSQAALIYYKPHVLKAGSSMTLRYRVAVHPGRWDADGVKAEQARFVAQARRTGRGNK